MGSHQQFSLYWNDYVKHITSAFDKLRCDEDLIDVTLSCEGKRIRAHKMLLSACSTYFKELFKENPCQHPVIIFRNVKYEDLSALVDFMYQGEVNVTQDQLTSFLTTAEMLAVQGLCDGSAKAESTEDNEIEEVPLSAGEVEKKRDPSNGVSQKNENQRASIAGTSAASSIPYFPEKQDSESPPASKRRKRQSNTPEELEHKSHLTALNENCDSDPIEIIEPEEQADVKLETVEYEEAARDNVGYGDSNLGMNAVTKTERDQLRAVSQLLGHDLSEMYSGNSQDSSQQQPAENMSLDISQMLQKPGPSSGDNHSQDSLQGNGQLSNTRLVSARYITVKEAPRLFCCELCSKSFKHPHSLKLHQKSHTGETKCPVCNVVLSRTYELRVHMRNRHNIVV